MKDRIRELRIRLGLTQAEFAEKLHISGAAVSKLESGTNSPSDQTIAGIVDTWHVSEVWIRTGAGEMFAKTDTDDIASKYDLPGAAKLLLNALINKYRELDPAQQIVVNGYVQNVMRAVETEASIQMRVDAFEEELKAEASDPGKSSVSPDTGESIG